MAVMPARGVPAPCCGQLSTLSLSAWVSNAASGCVQRDPSLSPVLLRGDIRAARSLCPAVSSESCGCPGLLPPPLRLGMFSPAARGSRGGYICRWCADSSPASLQPVSLTHPMTT